jgi:hypothetical protein
MKTACRREVIRVEATICGLPAVRRSDEREHGGIEAIFQADGIPPNGPG